MVKTQFPTMESKEGSKENKLKRMSILSVSIPDLETANDHKMAIFFKKT